MRLHLTGLLLFTCLGVSLGAYAQEDDCGGTENSKAEKLYNKGLNKKYSKGERIMYLQEALEMDEEYVDAAWALGEIQLKEYTANAKPMTASEGYFIQIIQECPQYHSSPYYALATISYNRNDLKTAIEYYNQFLDFEDEDDAKFSRRYDEFVIESKRNLKTAKFYYEQFAYPKPFDVEEVLPISTTDQDEYLPLISPDGSGMYFTRRWVLKNARDNIYGNNEVHYVERFSYAPKDGDGYTVGEALEFPFNQDNQANYGGATITIDNKELYYTVCEKGGGYINCDIFYSRFEYGYASEEALEKTWHWTEPERMGEAINGRDSWEAQPTVSKDGDWLLFASSREGSRGIDIYESHRDEAGNWSEARNIGEPINTDQHDKTPFFHTDSKTLYFASKGHLNHGGYDVFYSRIGDDGKWLEPENIGYPINSEKDEHGFIVSTDGSSVYFASKQLRETEKINIYHFDLYEEARPEEVVFVKGRVLDDEGHVPAGATVTLKNPETKEEHQVKVDSVDGSYVAVVNVKEDEEVVMSIESKGMAFQSFLIDKSTGTIVKKDAPLKELKVGGKYQLNNINYKTNSADLSDESLNIIQEFANYLIANPGIRVSIEGHTDSEGDAAANLSLSTDRAYSVMAQLQERGVDAKRLEFKGWGESKPIATNDTAYGRSLNRRTEFVILAL